MRANTKPACPPCKQKGKPRHADAGRLANPGAVRFGARPGRIGLPPPGKGDNCLAGRQMNKPV